MLQWHCDSVYSWNISKTEPYMAKKVNNKACAHACACLYALQMLQLVKEPPIMLEISPIICYAALLKNFT